jgi:hypothetical protein
MPKKPWLNDAGTVALVHVAPPSDVITMTPIELFESPAITQCRASVHDTALKPDVPLGAVCGLHVAPPSVVARIVWLSPTATQVESVGHDTPRSFAVLPEVSVLEVAQPSVVPTMTAVLVDAEYPAKVQCMTSAHERPDAAPEPATPVYTVAQCTPSVVRSIKALPDPPWFGPETPEA